MQKNNTNPEKEAIKNKIAELEQWLVDNHPEHLARPVIATDLRMYKEQLQTLEKNEVLHNPS